MRLLAVSMIIGSLFVATAPSPVAAKNGVTCDNWAHRGVVFGRRAFPIPRGIREPIFKRRVMDKMPDGMTADERRCVRDRLVYVFDLFEDACSDSKAGSGPKFLNREIGFDGALYAGVGALVLQCKGEY